jgi:hypothetical protein
LTTPAGDELPNPFELFGLAASAQAKRARGPAERDEAQLERDAAIAPIEALQACLERL